jgi:type IV pilus assembly protein PilE
MAAMTSPLHTGFSLIETLIVVALIAILSSIAMPAYQQWILRSDRSDALTALAQIQVQQEHFFLQNQRYARNVTELRASPPAGLGFSSGLSERGLYQLTLSSSQPGDYLATAGRSRLMSAAGAIRPAPAPAGASAYAPAQ